MTSPGRFLVVASGLPLNERTQWTRESLRSAVWIAQSAMHDERAHSVAVRGCHGEGETLYRLDREDGKVIEVTAVSAVRALLHQRQ